MTDIVTLTMNPSVDLSTSVGRVEPVRKLRCQGVRRDAGGGGINVARMVRRLGGDVVALYTAGGVMGQVLETLVARDEVDGVVLPIDEHTRESFTVFESETKSQYRFVLAGPEMTEAEREGCLDALAALDPFPRYVVASGSLPPGAPDDYYARVARLARERGAKMALDTSGPSLKASLAEGVFLIKPNLVELAQVTSEDLDTEEAEARACRRIIDDGQAEVVALTLGDRGALLATRDATWRAPAVPIEPASAVGAGDSFLGGMIWALAAGRTLEDAFRAGMAAGAATLMTPGTELAHPDDVRDLLPKVELAKV